jgi:glutamine synthetase
MQRAHAYAKVVIPAMEEVRAIADQIEPLLGEEYKPFPSYEDLLFSVQ